MKTLKIQVKIYRLDSTRPHVITYTNCLHYTFLSVSFHFYLILFLICFSWMKIFKTILMKSVEQRKIVRDPKGYKKDGERDEESLATTI